MKVWNEKSLKLEILETMRDSANDQNFSTNFDELNKNFNQARLSINSLLYSEPLREIVSKWESGNIRTLTEFLSELKNFSNDSSLKNREDLSKKLFGSSTILNKINFYYLKPKDDDFFRKPLIKLKEEIVYAISFAMDKGYVEKLFYNILGLNRSDNEVRSAENFLKNLLDSSDYSTSMELKNDLIKLFYFDEETLKNVEFSIGANYDYKESKIVFSKSSDCRWTKSKTNQLKLNPIFLDYNFINQARNLAVKELESLIYEKFQDLLLTTYSSYLMGENTGSDKNEAKDLYFLTEKIQLIDQDILDKIVLNEFKVLKDFDLEQRKIILESINRNFN